MPSLGAGSRRIALLALALIGTACGGPPRTVGDPDGLPLRFVVTLDLERIHAMSTPVEPLYVPMPLQPWHDCHGLHHGFADPFWDPWPAPPPTRVDLLAGDGPAQAQVFRHAVHPGSAPFTVPVRPGRRVTLSLQVLGGRSGWESLGSFTAPSAPGCSVAVRITGTGSGLVVLDAAGHPLQDPPAAAAPPPMAPVGPPATVEPGPAATPPRPAAAAPPAPP